MFRNWLRLNVRRGFSIPLAMLGGGVIAVVMAALSFYSQGEMRSVKHLLENTACEYLSYSGMVWSYDKLCREGRWYQPADSSLKTRNKAWANAWVGNPDFSGEASGTLGISSITLFLDEVRANKTKMVKGLTINPGNATPGLPLLDHIKVLARGKSGNEECLLYGKMVMMPEPILNSNVMAGSPEDDPGDPEAGEYVIRVPPIQKKMTGYGAKIEPGYIWSSDSDLTERVMIKTVLASKGQKVRMEDYVVTMNTECDCQPKVWATQEPKLRARFDGVVKDILVKPGDIVTEGTELAIIKKDPVQKTVKLPLLKLVRITKVPRDVYRNLDLTRIKDRYQVYEHIARLNNTFLTNYDPSLTEGAVEGFFRTVASSTMKSADLDRFPPLNPTANASETINMLVRNQMFNFVPPFGFDAKRAKDFSGSATYVLGVQPREITPQLRELLEIHGQKLHGDKNFYLAKLDTMPKKLLREQKKDIYIFKSDKPDGATEDFIHTMSSLNGAGPANPQAPPEDFIKRLSVLKDGAAYASIYLNMDTPWETPTFNDRVKTGKITDPENYFFWKNSKGEEGYWKYAPESAINVKTVDVPYYYENPMPIDTTASGSTNLGEKDPAKFRMQVTDIMNFFRKFYDESVRVPPQEILRPDDDIEDTPQAPGPPDATGCIFSGVSS